MAIKLVGSDLSYAERKRLEYERALNDNPTLARAYKESPIMFMLR